MHARRLLGLVVVAVSLLTLRRARADEKADALLKEVMNATQAVQSLTADIVHKSSSNGKDLTTQGTVKLMRPNFARVEQSSYIAVSDGKTLYHHYTNNNTFVKLDADAQGKNVGTYAPVRAFFGDSFMTTLMPSSATTRVADNVIVDGTEYRVIEGTYRIVTMRTAAGEVSKDMPVIVRLFIGPDNLIRGHSSEAKPETGSSKNEWWLKNVRTGVPLTAADFAYELPKDAKPFAPRLAGTPAAPRPPLVAVGEPAPDFNLPTLSGNKLELSEFVKGKKAVLVNFWFLN